MRDKELYAAILSVRLPWHVTSVTLDPKAEEVRVLIEAVSGTRFPCSKCKQPYPGYDSRQRSFRHLDTCQFKTPLDADDPRIQRTEHGVLQIDIPWAEPNSGFAALREALIIDWLQETSIQAVARRMNLSSRWGDPGASVGSTGRSPIASQLTSRWARAHAKADLLR